MASKRISELAAISALDDDDVMVVIEDGATKKVTIAELRSALFSLDLAWTDYAPTLKAVSSDPTLGSGSSAAGSYAIVGDLVIVRVGFVFGSSGAAAGSGEYYVAAPVGTMHSSSQRFVGSCFAFQGGTGRVGVCDLDLADERAYFWVDGQTGRVTNAAPAAWANNHQLHAEFAYRNG